MTLPASGSISIANIAGEFGGSTPYSLATYIRGGAYVQSGDPANANIPTTASNISFNGFHGAERLWPFTLNIPNNTQGFVVNTALTSAGWNGTSKVAVTINNTGTCGASSTSAYAFTLNALPSGSTVVLNNTGYITGAGGNGSRGGYPRPTGGAGANGVAGNPGGPCMYLAYPITINNGSGYIYSGGGGGGGGAGRPAYGGAGGGGGGGGAGYPAGVGGVSNGSGASNYGCARGAAGASGSIGHGGNGGHCAGNNGNPVGAGGGFGANGGVGGKLSGSGAGQGGGGGGPGASGGAGGNYSAQVCTQPTNSGGCYGYRTEVQYGGGAGAGHGLAITHGTTYVTWSSGSSRVYGGQS